MATEVAGFACDCCGRRRPRCCLSDTTFAGMDTTACVTCRGGDIVAEHEEHDEEESSDES